ncbi:hypothetical protein P3X46_002092 [Hevea brasiliensis]|uniref:HAT C-terminal dimerisation domain-containing protein n=1 Tax=Hevea brasiliensis TaxID=3981 RepID=A0ABQ9N4E4_HEVBR|nr:hypothetical protein P3X46_002092 [Hevea brasiliensis]
MDITALERDPTLRPLIWEFPVNQRDEIRRAYLKADLNSPHRIAMKCSMHLLKQSQHIYKLIENQTSQELENKHLQLKATIDSVWWLAFQWCAFRGHYETANSQNRGNFIELLKLLATYDAKVAKVILENSERRNAKYTSNKFQKEILHIFASMRFFDVVHVKDTTSLTFKNEICNVLSHYDLHVENITGQGYDGASNMRGEWNALFLKDCHYAYYVHCMAHRLQLALFFTNLSFVINVIVGSSKRNDELQEAQAIAIENMIANNEIETGKGSICSLLRMFNATCFVINTISKEGANYSIQGDAEATYLALTSFEFSQDIVNAIQLVSTTKALIQDLRDDGWQPLLENVKAFCSKNEIDIPSLEGIYTRSRSKYRHQGNSPITIEHHFKVDIFCATIDCQLQELNSGFCDRALELITLSSSLNPKNAYRSFKIDDICNLVDKFYPKDFTEQEKMHLRFQLGHYELDIPKDPDFQNLATLFELYRAFAISGKSKIYHLVDKLVRLVLTLPVSTTTIERAFSAMKLVKTILRDRMEDKYLADNLIVYIEKEIAKNFTAEMIMD